MIILLIEVKDKMLSMQSPSNMDKEVAESALIIHMMEMRERTDIVRIAKDVASGYYDDVKKEVTKVVPPMVLSGGNDG